MSRLSNTIADDQLTPTNFQNYPPMMMARPRFHVTDEIVALARNLKCLIEEAETMKLIEEKGADLT
jgi:hypothetical protein